MDNLAGMVFMMLLPIFYGAMAVFLLFILYFFLIRLSKNFSNSDDYKELYR